MIGAIKTINAERPNDGYNFGSVKNSMESLGINVWETFISDKQIQDAIIFLCSSDFIKYMQQSNIKDVFVSSRQLKDRKYMMDDDVIMNSYMSEQEISLLNDTIDEYNEVLMQSKDLVEFVHIAANKDGQLYAFTLQNEICMYGDEYPIGDPRELLEFLRFQIQDDVQKLNAEFERNVENEKRELRKILLEDPKFMKCTNQKLRKEYMRLYVEKKLSFENLKRHWLSNGYLSESAYNFAEMTWKEYKEK